MARKINFNIPITDLEGKPMKQGAETMKVNEILANMMSIAKPVKSAIRQMDIALKIYNGKEEVEVDDEDIEMMKQIVNQSNTSALVAGHILRLLEKKPEVKK